MIKTIEVKLYPTESQVATLESWLRICCWIYNRALEQRIKAYRRRGESVSCYDQTVLLTSMRSRMCRISSVPAQFGRGALRRVDRGFKAFFRRLKSGGKPGFPRFRPHQRYNSLEHLFAYNYVCGNAIKIPKLGTIRFRGQPIPEGTQKALRVIRRASGWYAQLVIDDGKQPPAPVPIESEVGIDVGLTRFATLSNGETIANPRFLRKSQSKLRVLQKTVSRRIKGSRRRKAAVKRLARQHELVAAQRRDFCHQESRKIVNRFDRIVVEDLNVDVMAKGSFSKSLSDAAWTMFIIFLTYKAASAGKSVIKVNPRGTSQECHKCGTMVKKKLSDRVHHCPNCNERCDRDFNAAVNILNRGSSRGRGGGIRPDEPVGSEGAARESQRLS